MRRTEIRSDLFFVRSRTSGRYGRRRMSADARRCSAALAELTGFSHAVFVHSGTAALELALLALTERAARVAMPALACWTVPFAIEKVGRTPVFVEVDEAWAIQKPPVAS